ncbi:hypothetical protein Hanom_Chr00s000484g01645841 [Helianthus anomalus]
MFFIILISCGNLYNLNDLFCHYSLENRGKPAGELRSVDMFIPMCMMSLLHLISLVLSGFQNSGD